jgi:hypothetical protein
MNLWFTATMSPEGLVEHRRRAFRYVAAADGLLAGVLVFAALFVAAAREELTAIILVVSIASLASLLIIEPATTRSAGLVEETGSRK